MQIDFRSQRITRRATLAGAAGGIVALTHARARAQHSAPAAPRVWLDMDQGALDDAYDQSKYAPNLQQIVKRYATNSEAVRARIGAPKRFPYGTSPIEGLDLYPTKRSNAPVHVHIHGGAWRAGLAKDHAYAAELFVNSGAHFAVLDFNNVVETKGDLMPMAAQVRSAVAWIYKNAASFDGDANRIYVSGHSSGAHLGGAVLVTEWQKEFGLSKDVVKGALLISGMYELKPVRLSARSSYVKFTDEMEQALSTERHLDKLNCPVIVAHGTLETPEFQRQSRDFAAAVRAAGKEAQLLVGEGYNHFEMPETLHPYGLLGRAVLAQMKLMPA